MKGYQAEREYQEVKGYQVESEYQEVKYQVSYMTIKQSTIN